MTTEEKKDIHNLEKNYHTTYEKLENDSCIILKNKNLIINFLRDSRLGKTLKNRRKKVVEKARCLKYLQLLTRLSSWINIPFDEVNQTDMEKFIEDLENDKYRYVIKTRSGDITKSSKFKHSTKLDYKKTLKKFYKWLFGNNEHYPPHVDWIETYDIVNEISSNSREQAEYLARGAKTRDKAIIMPLFDSGVRVEELLNVRENDLVKTDDIYKVRISYSKTKLRTIHLPISSKYLKFWLAE